jgi:hypothetical protein
VRRKKDWLETWIGGSNNRKRKGLSMEERLKKRKKDAVVENEDFVAAWDEGVGKGMRGKKRKGGKKKKPNKFKVGLKKREDEAVAAHEAAKAREAEELLRQSEHALGVVPILPSASAKGKGAKRGGSKGVSRGKRGGVSKTTECGAVGGVKKGGGGELVFVSQPGGAYHPGWEVVMNSSLGRNMFFEYKTELNGDVEAALKKCNEFIKAKEDMLRSVGFKF